MAEVIHSPTKYLWPDYESGAVGKLHSLKRVSDPNVATHIAVPPVAMPTEKRAYNRERTFYRDFMIESLARVPQRDSNYVEIIIVVRWVVNGRDQVLTLTSCVSRRVGEGLA